MKKYKKWLQIAILLAVIVVGVYTLAGNLFSDHDLPKAGEKAPDFQLSGLDGGKHRLSDLNGDYVLLNFWGSFCNPCVEEMPALQNQVDKYKDKLKVIGVNLDESQVAVKAFVREHSISFPIWLDHNDVRRQYGVMSYPTSFLISPDGTIVEKIEKGMNEKEVEDAVERLFAS